MDRSKKIMVVCDADTEAIARDCFGDAARDYVTVDSCERAYTDAETRAVLDADDN